MTEKPIKAIIIDDELHCISALKKLLAGQERAVEVIASFTSAKEALLGLRELSPDLVFLDVEMPWMNGMELLTALGQIDFQVIFTTAHDQYAVQAFRLSAIDYLLKPVESNSLSEALARIDNKSDKGMNEGIKQLNHNLSNIATQHRIAIPTRDGLDYILIEDILYCEADSNYTHIVLRDNKKLLMSKPLKELALQLRPYNYLRIHHSYLINLNHMVKYVRGNAGYVIMADGKSLPVSRAKKQDLLRRVGMV
jgi:two-component system LytT family response regulator